MAKYDIEDFLDQVTSFLRANLNTRLTEIVAERGDDITPKPVSNDAYFIQTLNENIANYDPYVFIGVLDPVEVRANGPVLAKTYHVNVALVVADSGEDRSLWKRLYRYQRALEELFDKYWRLGPQGGKVSCKAYILPAPPELRIQQVGVLLEVTIA